MVSFPARDGHGGSAGSDSCNCAVIGDGFATAEENETFAVAFDQPARSTACSVGDAAAGAKEDSSPARVRGADRAGIGDTAGRIDDVNPCAATRDQPARCVGDATAHDLDAVAGNRAGAGDRAEIGDAPGRTDVNAVIVGCDQPRCHTARSVGDEPRCQPDPLVLGLPGAHDRTEIRDRAAPANTRNVPFD